MSSLCDRFFSTNKSLTLMGMSGVGKTRLGLRLQKHNWFHYSVDYRIGTRYLDEDINEDLKRMVFDSNSPLTGLLRSDSISISHKITCRNLEPLSKFLGGLGLATYPNDQDDRALSSLQDSSYFSGLGRSLEEFTRRQSLHQRAEIAATQDIVRFIRNARDIYHYPHFVNDASGSLCDIIPMQAAPEGHLIVDSHDETVQILRNHTLLIYIESDHQHHLQLIARNRQEPKPLFYRHEVLSRLVQSFMNTYNLTHPDQICPASFSQFAFTPLLEERLPRYRALAQAIGITIPLKQVTPLLTDEVADQEFMPRFTSLITQAIELHQNHSLNDDE